MRGAALVLAIATLVGAGAWRALRSRRNGDAAHVRAELLLDIEQGGIADLGRAQARGRRLVLADPRDLEAAAAVAFTNAVLTVDYGLDTRRETEEALARVPAAGPPGDANAAMAAAARALLRLGAGDREAAARDAAGAAAATPGFPYPLYALGRTRARTGDLPGAQRALEAAIVGAPGFRAARVTRAEARLDLGDARTAREALGAVVAEAPRDLRARLLLEEAEQALGGGASPTLDAACAQGRWPPPAVDAGCALAEAERARRGGARAEARTKAEAAARLAPGEPRLLARTAFTLAQLGALDRAAALLVRARQQAGPQMPALAWATAAVALGQGRAGALPGGPRPADPETRLLIARTALAAGGVGALRSALDALGPAALAGDADLRALARLRSAPGAPTVTGPDDPARAYVDGLRAHLAGDLPAAAEHFQHALSGHGDACRAAGEYVATLRALKRRADPAAFAALRAENAGCVNLR